RSLLSFFPSKRRHTSFSRDWSSDVCPSDLVHEGGRVKQVFDCSTTGPMMARTVAAELAKKGIVYLDSPVSGGIAGATNGTLAVKNGRAAGREGRETSVDGVEAMNHTITTRH